MSEAWRGWSPYRADFAMSFFLLGASPPFERSALMPNYFGATADSFSLDQVTAFSSSKPPRSSVPRLSLSVVVEFSFLSRWVFSSSLQTPLGFSFSQPRFLSILLVMDLTTRGIARFPPRDSFSSPLSLSPASSPPPVPVESSQHFVFVHWLLVF